MMVGHFFAVDTAVDIGNKASGRGKEFELYADADQILNRIPHIYGEILTVCLGIGTEFFSWRLCAASSVCRAAEAAVGIPLNFLTADGKTFHCKMLSIPWHRRIFRCTFQ